MPVGLLRSQTNRSTNALVHLTLASVRQNERPAINRLLKGKAIAVKDNIATYDAPTTCSSNILKSEFPIVERVLSKLIAQTDFISPFDATVVERIRNSDGELVGKANCDEFGMGYASISSGP